MSLSDLIPPPSAFVTILENRRLRKGFRSLYRKYRAFTMIHEAGYVNNLELCARFATVPGCVVDVLAHVLTLVRRPAAARQKSRDFQIIGP